METKHEKFVRLAEARVNRTINLIRSISKLSNRNHYDFSKDELKEIFQAIEREVGAMQAAFNSSLSTEQKNRFKLKKMEAVNDPGLLGI